MKAKLLGLLLSLASAGIAGTIPPHHSPPTTRVAVAFIHPERFTDVGSQRQPSERDREGTLRNLGAAMQRSAAEYLRDDLRLEIKVKDVDLAGDFEWWRGASFDDVRVLRDLYPPRMKIEYCLRDSRGHLLNQGETRLSNQDYLFGIRIASRPLAHDKALFRDWLRKELSEFGK